MPRALCCLPIQVKSKYYPLILAAIFTVFFGAQIDFFAGLSVGYLYVFGFLKWTDTSAVNLRNWENRFPFKNLKNEMGFRANISGLQNNPTSENQ